MDLREYVDVLHRTEQETDVNRWTFRGIHVWPVFRAATISMFRNPESYFNQRELNSQPRLSFRERIGARIKSKRARRNFQSELEAKLGTKKCDVLVYSRSSTHTDVLSGKRYDRFADPFVEKLSGRKRVAKVMLGVKESDHSFVHTPIVLNDREYKEYVYHERRLRSPDEISASEVFAEVSSFTGLKFSARAINAVFNEIMYYRDLFLEVLKHLSPEFIFLKGYYETDAAGLILAARELKIKTIDIQHGKQGIFHPMYSHWSRVPEGGYELLPDFFWTWGEESRNNIGKWMPQESYHTPVTGGNLWLAKWKNEDVYVPTDRESDFVSSLADFQRVVLYTMQPLDAADIIPDIVAESIRTSPPHWIWLLRTHPLQKVNREELLQRIGDTRCRVEIEFSSALPLYYLLKKVHHHITLWSSTAFEANDFDVPTIIAHPMGQSLYEQQIRGNVFSAGTAKTEILKLISENTKNTRTHYIETDEAIADAAFGQIGLTSGQPDK